MAICLKHNQSYNPIIGEFCPYCGCPNPFYDPYKTEKRNQVMEKSKEKSKTKDKGHKK